MHKNIFFHIDTPPLRTKGFGLSVLMYSVLKALGNTKNKVITYLSYADVSREEILADAEWETILVNSPFAWIQKFRPPHKLQKLLLFLGFLFCLPNLFRRFRRSPEDPILFCIGASGEPLVKAIIISYLTKNPLWLYIVDDLEKINEIIDNRYEKFLINSFLAPVISRADRLIVISESLKAKYKRKYNKESDLLLPCFPPIDKGKLQKTKSEKDIFYFVFTGGLSFLYNSTLRTFYESISRLNRSRDLSKEYRLIIQTYSSRNSFEELFPENDFVEYHTSPGRSSFQYSYQIADCFLIPYSFEEEHQDHVSTSFPQKVAELIQLERPLLVFGPVYSSVVGFFEENKLEFLVTAPDPEHLEATIKKIDLLSDCRGWLDCYADRYQDSFSPAAVKAVFH